MAEFEHILYDVKDGIATVTMNRPEAINGMTTRMLGETYEALLGASRDASVKVVVLTGAGKAFCPGADLKAATSGTLAGTYEGRPEHYRVAVLLHEMPALSIAQINGACAGAGFSWACGADIRVASRSAIFRTAFLNVAVAGDMGIPWSLPRLVGAAKARELSFLCEKFTAEEALRIGFVAKVWDDDTFRAEADALTRRLADSAPLALRATKAHYVSAERMSFQDYVDLETRDHEIIMRSEDTSEAFRAFVEKRTATYKGR